MPNLVFKAGTAPSFITITQDGVNPLKYNVVGKPEGSDLKVISITIELSLPLYPNLKIEVPFQVTIECHITQIKAEFAPTPFYYYIDSAAATPVDIDLRATVYN